jgi:hypothetical protein
LCCDTPRTVAHLETPDDLVAALLGNLALEVLPRTGLVLLLLLARDLLGVAVNVGIDTVLQGVGTSTGTTAGVDTGRPALRLVASSSLAKVLGVVRSAGVSSRCGLVGGMLDVLLWVTAIDTLSLLLQVLLGEVGGVVPGVVLGGTIHVAESILIGANSVGGVAGSIGCHIAEQDASILDFTVC